MCESQYIIYFILYISDEIAPSLSVLRIGSMEVGALLNDAYKEYEVSIKLILLVLSQGQRKHFGWLGKEIMCVKYAANILINIHDNNIVHGSIQPCKSLQSSKDH